MLFDPVVEVQDLRDSLWHTFLVLSMTPKNPDFSPDLGWPEAGAVADIPLSKEERMVHDSILIVEVYGASL